MKEITIALMERIGLLLVIAFVLTRIPNIKTLLYREYSRKVIFIHAIVFGLFAIVSSHLGFVFSDGEIKEQIIVWNVKEGELVISLSLIAVVIAGLLGGPLVGLGAGIIAGVHLAFLGGIGLVANMLVNPLSGLLAGLTGRFFSKARVISPMQAVFIGVFPPILQMQLLLVIYPQNEKIVQFVNVTGLPLVLSNSVAIGIFTAMIGIVLKEQENEAAIATRQALTIAEEALPFLKSDSPQERAEGIANLLYDRLEVAAISVTYEDEVLAFVGIGSDHHRLGQKIITPLSKEALETQEVKIAHSRADIACDHPDCPLEAAIIIPITEANDTTSLIKFYFRKSQHISPVEKVFAQGIGQLISNQLKVIANEKLKENIRDAELRNLQAQINPHFLFNTLHLIATLFRVDPKRARHITIQLANFMRFNLGLAQESLISLEREWEHVKAYTEIIQARFSNRLQINFDKDHSLSDVLIPPSTIQPLVENSIQHGLKNVSTNGRIDVSIKKKGERVFITVQDNGVGFKEIDFNKINEPPQGKTSNGGVGLYNVNRRLISLLGEESRLQIENIPTGGCKVYFSIPISTVRRNVDEY